MSKVISSGKSRCFCFCLLSQYLFFDKTDFLLWPGQEIATMPEFNDHTTGETTALENSVPISTGMNEPLSMLTDDILEELVVRVENVEGNFKRKIEMLLFLSVVTISVLR